MNKLEEGKKIKGMKMKNIDEQDTERASRCPRCDPTLKACKEDQERRCPRDRMEKQRP